MRNIFESELTYDLNKFTRNELVFNLNEALRIVQYQQMMINLLGDNINRNPKRRK
jgi:hypothetical protein